MDVRIAAVAMSAAAPLATWMLVGDLSSDGFTEDELDYIWRAPSVPWLLEAVIGAVALAVFVVSAVAVFHAVLDGELPRNWLPTVVLPAVAGVLLGFGARAVTAGVIGANIGGGLFMLLGLPFVAVLLIAAAANAWTEIRRRP